MFDVDRLRNWRSSRLFDTYKIFNSSGSTPWQYRRPTIPLIRVIHHTCPNFLNWENLRMAGSVREYPTPPQPSPLLPLFALQLSPIGNVICSVHKPFLLCSPTFNKLVKCFMQKPTTTKQNKAKHIFSQIKVEWQPPLPSPPSSVKTISSLLG